MRPDVVAALAIALSAFALRLSVVLAVGDVALAADMVDYYDRARHVASSGQLYPDAFRVPLYSLVMGAWIRVFGEGLFGLRILQSIVGALTAAATFALARQTLSRRRSVAAGLIVALYPGLIAYSVYLMAEPLFTLLVVLSVLVAVARSGRLSRLIAGALGGAAVMTRQAGIVIVAALAVWQLTIGWTATTRRLRATIVASLLLVAGAGLALAPWIIRNYSRFGRWVPFETTGGITFFMANYEDATGKYELRDWHVIHERYLNRAPEEFTRNAMAYEMGLKRIQEDPWRILKLVPYRLGYFFDAEGREHVWLYTSGYFGRWNSVVIHAVGWAILLAFPALVAATLAGLSFGPALRQPAEVALGTVVAAAIVQNLGVYGDPRFHLPLIPLLAVLAVREWPRPAPLRSARVVAGVVASMLLVSWWAVRLPEQIRVLQLAASPNGSQLALPY